MTGRDARNNLADNLTFQLDGVVTVPRVSVRRLIDAYDALVNPSLSAPIAGDIKVHVLRGSQLLVGDELVVFPELPDGRSPEYVADYFRRLATAVEQAASVVRTRK